MGFSEERRSERGINTTSLLASEKMTVKYRCLDTDEYGSGKVDERCM
jgi:hypothetical protein